MRTVSEVLDYEFSVVITELFKAARHIGFDLSTDADVERLNRITDGGRVRRSCKNDAKGKAKACREIPEYAAATFTETVLSDAFHFLHRYQMIKESHSNCDPKDCDAEVELVKLLGCVLN